MRRIPLLLLPALLVGCDNAVEPELTPGMVSDLLAVEHAEGRFVGVGTRFHFTGQQLDIGSDSVLVAFSEDGRTWSQAQLGPRGSLSDVAFGNDTWLAVGPGPLEGTEGAVFTSADGETWTERPVPPYRWRSVVFGEGVFLAAGYDPAANQTVVATSADGEVWTEVARISMLGGRVAFGDGQFVLHGQSRRVSVSDDTESWDVTSLTGPNWVTVLRHVDGEWVGIGLFVTLGGFATYAIASPDAVDWTVTEVSGVGPMEAIAAGAGAFVGIGEGTIWRASSVDNWNVVVSVQTALAVDVIYADGGFVAVGRNGSWSSTNGSSWASHALPELTPTP